MNLSVGAQHAAFFFRRNASFGPNAVALHVVVAVVYAIDNFVIAKQSGVANIEANTGNLCQPIIGTALEGLLGIVKGGF